ncbi:MAG: AAA family ATPase [Myxococcota bacterium]|nr:AAA family ATPase [Myxococcota bacterium]
MPLTSIRLENFKCFEDTTDVTVAPLTIVFGRNNSGKSSILQGLFLLRQTLDSPEQVAGLSRLNIRGPLYPAGTYVDAVHGHRSKVRMKMHVGLTVPGQSGQARIELHFRSDDPQSPLLERLAVEVPGQVAVAIQRGRGKGGPYEMWLGDKLLGIGRKAGFHFPVDSFLPKLADEPPGAAPGAGKQKRIRRRAMKAIAELATVLGRLRAVGAFRRQPERRYDFHGRTPEVVAMAGEYVANALIEDATRRRKPGELRRSVNRRLREVGRVHVQAVRRLFARTYELRMRDLESGQWANYTDVGFGIGQALPVLVEGLRTAEGGTFIVQEPEIHLHPDAQLVMADFLIDLVRSGRRVIVETHSDNLLLRVRHNLVRRKPRLAPNELSVVVVEKARKGPSSCRNLDVDRLGQIENWPAQFMQEATQERMAILDAVAKRVERSR